MKVVCAWCQPKTEEKEKVSHGLCKKCANKLRKELGLPIKKED